MNIFQTFEDFLALPFSIIKNKILQFILVEDKRSKSSIDFNSMEHVNQFTIVNNKKVYRLLTSVAYKKKEINEKSKRKVYN